MTPNQLEQLRAICDDLFKLYTAMDNDVLMHDASVKVYDIFADLENLIDSTTKTE